MAVIHLYDMDRLCCVWLFLVVYFHYALSQCEEEKVIPVGIEKITVRFPPVNQTTYEKFLFCEWKFVAEKPDMRIVYQISQVSVHCDDRLEVYPAGETSNKEKICCSNCLTTGPATRPVAVTPGRSLKIDFNSDGTTHDYEKGFEVTLVASKHHDYCPLDYKPIQVTSEKLQIASPNFPDLYETGLDCRYELTSPTGVIVQFQYIDVEVHEQCENSCCDVINIYQGAEVTLKNRLASMCSLQNFQHDKIYESVGTTLTLQFTTDAMGPFRGFLATVQAKEGNPITTRPPTTSTTIPTTLATTTEQFIEVLETLQHSRFELRCKIPTLENGVDISWTKDGMPFLTSNTNRYYFLEDNTLVVFTAILQQDSGVYVCEANDPFMTTYSARIVVNDQALMCTESTCNGNGTCIDNNLSYTCDCFSGYEGKHCEKDTDECKTSDFCKRGSCVNTVGTFYCDCMTSPGWTGPTCDQDIDECKSNVCPQNSVCSNSVGSYECRCKKGWSGPSCEIDTDECTSIPCSRNEVCENTPGTYRCTCKKGWTGLKCEEDIDECKNMPCSRNEVCENTPGTYRCTCKKGWTGLKCEILTSVRSRNQYVVKMECVSMRGEVTHVNVALVGRGPSVTQ
ncbi:uncharacterized protein LOC134229825, partial [Saccostrea cucullata]|uniref:uncharacterized protein LOC134229825 n=1 Tax=Saccostrea cuccullata TaxID=36930 RepID=UPI002ED216E4